MLRNFRYHPDRSETILETWKEDKVGEESQTNKQRDRETEIRGERPTLRRRSLDIPAGRSLSEKKGEGGAT